MKKDEKGILGRGSYLGKRVKILNSTVYRELEISFSWFMTDREKGRKENGLLNIMFVC